MQAVKRLLAKYPKLHYAPLAAILAIAGYFYFQNLGTHYITLWDEAVHVNVVKNLATHCCTPKLHLTDIGIDFQDWTSNYIWVHKPLMPLFLQAVFFKLGGGTLFAFRLPGALAALSIIVVLFWVGRRHFGFAVGIISAALFAFNPYVFELVKGRQFSGLHDLLFCLFGLLALNQLFNIAGGLQLSDHSHQRALKRHFLLFGIFAGFGYLSKGGLALLFFPPLLAATFLNPKFKQNPWLHLTNFCYAALAALLLVFPEKVILAVKFPAEYAFEQRTQILHLFKDLEYWGRPWNYYFTVYLKQMLGGWLYWPAFAAMAYAFYNFLKTRSANFLSSAKIFLTLVWILSFVFILSFGVSKISNFIFAALPGIFILLAFLLTRLRQWPVVAWLMPVLVVLAMGQYVKANHAREKTLPPGFAVQKQLKSAGEYAARTLPSNSVSLIWYPSLQKSHLFFKFWSGRDAVEIYDRQPIYHMEKLYPNRPVFVFSQERLARKELDLVQIAPFGYVYAFRPQGNF